MGAGHGLNVGKTTSQLSLYEWLQQTMQTGSQQQQGFSAARVILIVAVTLLLIGGGGLIYHTTISQPTQLTTTISTAQATATSQAVATIVAQANAQATATIITIQSLYTRVTRTTPAFNFPLSHQDSNHWDEDANCAFVGGSYHARESQPNSFFSCSPNTPPGTFSNFAFQVQMTIIKGDYGGLLFRSDSTVSNYYFLTMNQAGTYSLNVYRNDKQVKKLASGTSAVFNAGLNQLNLITVIAQGDSFYLYVNGQFAANASDTTYGRGSIAVVAGNNSHPTEVAFSNAKIWRT